MSPHSSIVCCARRRSRKPARLLGLLAGDGAGGAQLEAEPLHRGRVGRGVLLPLEADSLHRGVGAEARREEVRPVVEAAGEHDAPARQRVARGAHHALAAAVGHPALAPARHAEDGERVEPVLGDVGEKDDARALRAAAEDALVAGRGGERPRAVLELEVAAAELDRRRRRGQLRLEVEGLEDGDRDVLGGGDRRGLPAAERLDRVQAGRGELHALEDAALGQEDLVLAPGSRWTAPASTQPMTVAAGTVKERRTSLVPAFVSSASAAAGPETWRRRR